MSLHGYKPKTKPANWVSAFPPKAEQPKAKKRAGGRRQYVNQEYKLQAAAFVAWYRKTGIECPVVSTIEELRNGMAYGWPISSKITVTHHVRGRAGSLLTDQRYWLACSRFGHRWIHSHIAEARKRGWICEKGLWNTPEK